jgi:hypothetical protein
MTVYVESGTFPPVTLTTGDLVYIEQSILSGAAQTERAKLEVIMELATVSFTHRSVKDALLNSYISNQLTDILFIYSGSDEKSRHFHLWVSKKQVILSVQSDIHDKEWTIALFRDIRQLLEAKAIKPIFLYRILKSKLLFFVCSLVLSWSLSYAITLYIGHFMFVFLIIYTIVSCLFYIWRNPEIYHPGP